MFFVLQYVMGWVVCVCLYVVDMYVLCYNMLWVGWCVYVYILLICMFCVTICYGLGGVCRFLCY